MAVSFDSVLLELYRSLIETPSWESFLKLLGDYLDCRSCSVILRTPTESDSGLVVSESLGPTGSQAMIDAFHDSPFLHLPDEEIRVLSRLMPEAEFKKRHRRHHEYNQRVKTIDIVGFNLTNVETGTSFRFRLVRSVGSELFGDREIRELQALMPHLKNAVAIYGRLVHQQQQLYIADETSSQLGIGMLVLAVDGQVLTVNPLADSMLQSRKDFILQQGRLHCVDTETEQKLRNYLNSLKKGTLESSEESFQMPRSGGGSWLLILRRNEIPAEFRENVPDIVTVLVRDSAQGAAISVDQLMELFGLTPAEARLAERLVQGDSLSEAARKLERSRSTVRVQLASIFTKTGVHKQHQLISHIMHVASGHRL